jgi:hypothetical protein
MTNEEKMQQAIRELQDAMVVQASLEARLERGLLQCAKWLESHEARLEEQAARNLEQATKNREHEARMAHIEMTLAEAGDKLNALISFVAAQHGLPEA